jgi:hypothetical protein
VQKELVEALMDRQKKEADLVEAWKDVTATRGDIYPAQDAVEMAKANAEKAREEAA